MPTGLVVLDNNCFDILSDPRALSRFMANMRAADWEARPSEVNLLEVVATGSDERQRLLVDTLRVVADEKLLFRWPFAMLKELGEAIATGNDYHFVSLMDAAAYLDDREEAIRIRAETAAFTQRIEAAFIKLHDGNRSKMRRQMRERGITDVYGSAHEFIRQAWAQSETRAMFAEVTWQHLGLRGDPPMDTLDACEPWKLLLDVEGVAVYERAVAQQQPKRVQRLDLIQLVYLGLARRRMIATADMGLLRAANAVLSGRYANARAVHINALIS